MIFSKKKNSSAEKQLVVNQNWKTSMMWIYTSNKRFCEVLSVVILSTRNLAKKILSKVYAGEMNNSAKHDRKHKLYRNLDFLKQYITVERPYATIYRKRPLTHSTKTFPVKSLQLETS